jgi:Trehalose-phosphatase
MERLVIGPTKPFKPEQAAATRLSTELLLELVHGKRVLLCLDYDGTISEIVRDPAAARPVPGVLEALAVLAPRRDQIALAIVSGREVAMVRRRGRRKRAIGSRAPLALPDAINRRWSLDFVSDALSDGRRFRIFCVVDELPHFWRGNLPTAALAVPRPRKECGRTLT